MSDEMTTESGAGKGDTYRSVKKDRYDDTIERIFGKRDVMEFQKCNKIIVKEQELKKIIEDDQ